jgi:histidinol-phosphate aminotransferase
LLDTKRPGKEVIDGMAQQNVFIGRIWPIMPTWVRITVGTHEEMQHFQAAYQKVMRGTAAFSLRPARPMRNARRPELLS